MVEQARMGEDTLLGNSFQVSKGKENGEMLLHS